MPNELIVLFARDSPEHARMTAPGDDGRLDLGSLAPIVERLAETARVPLAAQRVGGGGALVVAIDMRALLGRVRVELRDRADVRTQEASPDGPTAAPALEVASTEKAKIEEAVRSIAQRLDVPLRVRTPDGDGLRVEIAADELVGRVAERLRTAPSVESVDRNVLERPMVR